MWHWPNGDGKRLTFFFFFPHSLSFSLSLLLFYWALFNNTEREKKTESIMLMLLCYRQFYQITVLNRMKYPHSWGNWHQCHYHLFFSFLFIKSIDSISQWVKTTKDKKINSRITSNDWLNCEWKKRESENEREFMLLPVDYFAIFLVCGHFCG